jgi:potassium/hydrogen antiporter
MLEQVMLIAGAFLVLSVLMSKATGRLGVPALLVFMGIGMLAGSDGPGGIHFDDAGLARGLGIVALAFILFGGGMNTPWQTVKPVWRSALSLSTLGVAITTGIVGVFGYLVVGLPLYVSLLLGAIMAATDAAAVFGLIGGQNMRLRPDVQGVLELESGTNDPTAVFLTLSFTALAIDPSLSVIAFLPKYLIQMAVGAGVGLIVGKAASWMLNHLRLPVEGMYSVLSIAAVLLAYGGAEIAHGNGFLAVYLAGIVYGHGQSRRRKGLRKFMDGVAWLMQIVMFLTLGLLVFPSRLPSVAIAGILTALVLMFVARPLAVFVGLVFSGFGWRAQTLVAWAGLRGAVPIVLATFPLLAGVKNASYLFDIVFFVVLTSALLQGTTLPWVARWQDQAEPPAQTPSAA